MLAVKLANTPTVILFSAYFCLNLASYVNVDLKCIAQYADSTACWPGLINHMLQNTGAQQMYPHRLVVDANCINAKGVLPAMTALEEYHCVGALELVVTSTLPVELTEKSIQASKAKQYQQIGGESCFFHCNGALQSQSECGVTVRPGMIEQLQSELFGYKLKGKALFRAIRDCLHLDQAQMNAADIFITKNIRLRAAEPLLAREGINLTILSPDEALEYLRKYYLEELGGDSVEYVEAKANSQGPVILGSNSCNGCTFIAEYAEEVLASFRVADGHLQIRASFRDETGQLVVGIEAGKRPEFTVPVPSAKVRVTQAGRGPILVSDEGTCSVVISKDHRIYFAARMTHTGRVVVYAMELRDKLGQLVVTIEKEKLIVLSGAAWKC
jgi:hypothetical protein